MCKKHNYKETFDRPPFIQEVTLPKRGANGKLLFEDGKHVYEKVNSEDTVPNVEFLHRNKITLASSPADWFNLFLPKSKHANSKLSISEITKWTNAKGLLEEKVLNFTTEEIMKHLGLYVLQGVSPCPKVEMKFSSQAEDPVNGSDLCCKIFGGTSKGKRRHAQFKKYFAVCDPIVPTPDVKLSPNWKIEKLVKQILHISKQAMLIGR